MHRLTRPLLIVIASITIVVLVGLWIRGTASYVWIRRNGVPGILRTDTNQIVLLPGFDATIQPEVDIWKNDPVSEITVTFVDRTITPGRVKLLVRDHSIDVMEKGVEVDGLFLGWWP